MSSIFMMFIRPPEGTDLTQCKGSGRARGTESDRARARARRGAPEGGAHGRERSSRALERAARLLMRRGDGGGGSRGLGGRDIWEAGGGRGSKNGRRSPGARARASASSSASRPRDRRVQRCAVWRDVQCAASACGKDICRPGAPRERSDAVTTTASMAVVLRWSLHGSRSGALALPALRGCSWWGEGRGWRAPAREEDPRRATATP